MAETPDLTGIIVMKPVPRGIIANWQQQPLQTVSGLLVRAELIEDLDAAETLRVLRLDYHYRHPITGLPVRPYRDEAGRPDLHLLRFALSPEMAAATRVPTAIELLDRMSTEDRASTPYVAVPLLKTPTGHRWPDTPFLGTGFSCDRPLVQELFLVGHHRLPIGTELLRRP